MNKKLYVGNLSYNATEEDLRALFAEIGPVVSAVVITEQATGRSKGFGFVEMETPEAAQQAIEKLNNTMFMQRSLTVSEARPQREQSSPRGDRFSDRRSNPGRGGDSQRRRRY